MLVGIISDTHGTLPPSVDAAFVGVDQILHAGDVGAPWIIDHLETIAPVIAVRGNMDSGDLGWRLPEQALLRFGTYRVLMIHHAASLLRDGLPPGVSVVVSGHTHRASVQSVDGVLYVNPGSAGGRSRDGRGPTVALLDCAAEPPAARIIEL
ncbi:MAG: metallophosphoesterase family protein [Coriobacteriia bacterium]|nr:metallophosphoesterase family protein [Coriobacteriia bacterium]MBN2839789.1 metallophosphoesterase family protein [Coriobacteriia bacterium]